MIAIGDNINNWIVLEYSRGKYTCECKLCGNKSKIQVSKLIHENPACKCQSKINKDLTGETFGEWEVIKQSKKGYWICKCSCGTVREVNYKSLLNGKSKSCGHNTNQLLDLTNHKFGELTVIGYVGNRKWQCKCSCGKIITTIGYNLTHGGQKSCGHIRSDKIRSRNSDSRDKLEGRTFGQWTVSEYLGDKKYKCICSCGKVGTVYRRQLVQGLSMSCGHKGQDRRITPDRIQYDPKYDNDVNIGKKFGKLTIINRIDETKYLCECECDNYQVVMKQSIEDGTVTQCYRCNNGFKNLKGKKFGEWEVIRYTENKKWLCKCSCGITREIAYGDLNRGKTKSCGHNTSGFKDLKGKKIGKLTVVEYIGDRRWRCICDCGKEHITSGYNLYTGITSECKSCTMKKASEVRKNNMMNKYGDYVSCNVEFPRSEEQIAAISSADTLEKFLELNNLIGKTAKQIAPALGINSNNVLRYIHRYKLEHLIDIESKSSKAEDELYEFIVNECTDKEVMQHDRNVIYPEELDIWIPELKIAIEYNGTYWHSEYHKSIKYHQDKTLKCARLGIRLIHIFEYEWESEQHEIIKRYLKGVISDEREIVYGRKITVANISNDESKEFLNNNHLQGYTYAEISIGAIYNESLIGIMTFSKPRFNKEYQWELVRFAWKDGIAVVGGAEKLFEYFCRNYKPKSIICYSDIAKFRGNVYARVGFKASVKDITHPGYVWVNPTSNDIKSRYSTQKHKLLALGYGDIGKTEDEIMRGLGYIKIYDCGHLRLTWEDKIVYG